MRLSMRQSEGDEVATFGQAHDGEACGSVCSHMLTDLRIPI